MLPVGCTAERWGMGDKVIEGIRVYGKKGEQKKTAETKGMLKFNQCENTVQTKLKIKSVCCFSRRH